MSVFAALALALLTKGYAYATPRPATTSYVIHDVGRPHHASSTLYGFNNTGQMYGTAYPNRNGNTLCEVWTGSAFLALSGTGAKSCYPFAISNANPSTGAYDVSGYVFTPFESQQVAFLATVKTAGTQFRTFTNHDDSELAGGVNSHGVAVGYAYDRHFQSATPPFAFDGTKFAPLQPGCKTFGPLCMSNVLQDYNTPGSTCPFGGCGLNDNNVVLGLDNYSSNLMVATVDSPTSSTDLPIQWGPAYPAGINDANQVAYGYQQPSSNAIAAFIYAVGASQPVALGTISGSDCVEYFPISLNNLGDVLGYNAACQTSSPTYWLYDHTSGTMSDLMAAVPHNHYSRVTPLGINDNAQILVELSARNGEHWGTLDPSGSPLRNRIVHGVAIPRPHIK
ncbi:MAG: hypothetical protein JO060_07110 [Candidatus Eremiobacteraeota bacterium]|nr:hypothetical protein [Candidatus Eremiobacteraeota bacterium]